MKLSQRAYAAHRKANGLAGGTPSAVRAAIAAGRLARSVGKDGQILDAARADAEWAATTHADRVPLTSPTANGAATHAPSPLQEHRARREAAEAAIAEIELAEKRRELVPAKDVESTLVNVFAHCKTKLLGIPARACQRDPSLSASQVKMIEELIFQALEDLASGRTTG